MPMSSAQCPNRDELLDYLVGKLPDDASELLSSHVEACPDCQAELATLSDIEDTLIGQLRGAAAPEPYLDESECSRAIAKAKIVGEETGVGQSSPETTEMSLSMQLGEYRLIERLGSGGMGAVYKALHNRLDRVVALKILPRSRTEDQRAVVRFEREMKAIGRLDHPHIVRAYDAREIEGRLVLVMEFVEGLDLGKIIRRLGQLGKGDRLLLCEAPAGPSRQKVPVPFSDACELARQAALGLQAAHEHGMVHRDVKPSNLMLTPEGEVKLLDLGLARLHGKGVGSLLCEAPSEPFRKVGPVPFFPPANAPPM
jgi:serine/threonine protein kinase